MPSPRRIVPCLWFDDQAEAAAAFYTQVLPEGRELARSHYPAAGDNPSGRPPGSVLTVEFTVCGQPFTALNGGPIFKPNPSISFFVELGSQAEVDRIHGALAKGGTELMPLGSYPWSPRYGWVLDRYGVSWQVMLARDGQAPAIVPALMFSGEAFGKAREALRRYSEVFPAGRILMDQPLPEGSSPSGGMMYGRALLDGQDLVAMDSPQEHAFGFDEGISLQVYCRDQAELDHFWEQLGAGGEHGPCGWLKDRYGISWQVVPEGIGDWMSSTDAAARDRAFAAMMTMGKLDIAALEAAFRG